MRVLVLHNRYRPTAPSGENAVVDQETAALRAAGHEVQLVQRHSAEIEQWSALHRAALPAQVLWSRSSQRLLAEQLEAFAPDVVHVHNTFPLLTPAVLRTCAAAAVPVVATVHNYKLACANGELFRDGALCHDCLGGAAAPAVKNGCYRSSRVATVPVVAARGLHARAWRELVSAYVFISAAQRDLLAPLGFPTQRCFVKHNFVADPLGAAPPDVPDGPSTRQPSEAPYSSPVVAFVGRLDEAKGVPLLMAAWEGMRARRPDGALRLVVAGGGPLAGEVERWAARRPEVEFVGLVPRSAVAQVLAGARAAVVPSQWEETFGLVAVEAMAVGTPPVVTDHGALPELVRDGRDGATFPAGDARALADLLADVEDRPARWAALGRRARSRYLEHFTEQRNVAQLEQVYRYAVEHPIGWSPGDPVSRRTLAGPLANQPLGRT